MKELNLFHELCATAAAEDIEREERAKDELFRGSHLMDIEIECPARARPYDMVDYTTADRCIKKMKDSLTNKSARRD